MKQEHDVIMEI